MYKDCIKCFISKLPLIDTHIFKSSKWSQRLQALNLHRRIDVAEAQWSPQKDQKGPGADIGSSQGSHFKLPKNSQQKKTGW